MFRPPQVVRSAFHGRRARARRVQAEVQRQDQRQQNPAEGEADGDLGSRQPGLLLFGSVEANHHPGGGAGRPLAANRGRAYHDPAGSDVQRLDERPVLRRPGQAIAGLLADVRGFARRQGGRRRMGAVAVGGRRRAVPTRRRSTTFWGAEAARGDRRAGRRS